MHARSQEEANVQMPTNCKQVFKILQAYFSLILESWTCCNKVKHELTELHYLLITKHYYKY